MSGGRPRTAIGTYDEIHVRTRGARFVAETRYPDLDGRLRKVNATATSRAAARTLLKERTSTLEAAEQSSCAVSLRMKSGRRASADAGSSPSRDQREAAPDPLTGSG